MAKRESKVEGYLKDRLEAVGAACEKHVNPGWRGDPDRLISFPSRYHCMVETKWDTGVTPEDHQLRRHTWWRMRGMDVYVLDSRVAVDLWMTKMRKHYIRD